VDNEDKGDRTIATMAALNEPQRRRLYRHVAAQDSAVSRDAASVSLGIPRSVAAFHLDKLADLGLLEVEYRRPVGRTGPGAGRPTKLYRRADVEIALSVPERHYDLAALLLAQAVEDANAGSVPVFEALRAVARKYGRSIGAQLYPSNKRSRHRLAERLTGLLAELGYEPRLERNAITLRNCPFHALAEEHRDLICAMNHELMRGVAEAAGLDVSAARLDPAPGRCCVSLST
jgi:predicted ArsR family transcriptional regulator